MPWWLWIPVGILLVPVVSVLLGLITVFLFASLPDGLLPVSCACCGRHGFWQRRTSLGYHLCEDCATSQGPRVVTKPRTVERVDL